MGDSSEAHPRPADGDLLGGRVAIVTGAGSRAPGIGNGRAAALLLASAGAKVAAVVQGRADVYVHAGGQYEWDSAAPVAVARAAGLFTSRIDGSPLIYNQADPKLPDLIVCRPELAEAVLGVTRGN